MPFGLIAVAVLVVIWFWPAPNAGSPANTTGQVITTVVLACALTIGASWLLISSPAIASIGAVGLLVPAVAAVAGVAIAGRLVGLRGIGAHLVIATGVYLISLIGVPIAVLLICQCM